MAEIDYSFGDNEELPAEGDNRREYRLTGNARIVLELESPSPDDPEGVRLTFHTRDLSPTGMRLRSFEPLTPQALLPAEVSFSGSGEVFPLTVEVVWCKPASDGRWLVGLSIIESDGTGYIDWVEAVASAMGEN
ncbi:MAG TPA: PilZ domain-containing protein [Marinobacter sp.]|jgi:hypothetical protein|uniref:PilZ domain-containing protein n=1 Tax=Marinobacter sp. TaxID=50741 RepID=UPI000ED92D17|nr:PilZ domain-containing protein [Marinobacter sp.]MBC7190958.1 PilZ domain-containing protein [Marinobacter sp.]HCW90960.1 PilZ domain-containing protein [Marinobacter sp.]